MDPDDPYAARLTGSMLTMGASVCKGAWTTFLGSLALIFSQSQAFRTFFLMFVGIIIIAALHGLLFVPSILGEFYTFFPGDDWKEASELRKKQERPVGSAVYSSPVSSNNLKGDSSKEEKEEELGDPDVDDDTLNPDAPANREKLEKQPAVEMQITASLGPAAAGDEVEEEEVGGYEE